MMLVVGGGDVGRRGGQRYWMDTDLSEEAEAKLEDEDSSSGRTRLRI